jgi:hypothetical protein
MRGYFQARHFASGHFTTLRGAATHYGVHTCVIRKLADKLNLAQERSGRTRILAPAELPVLEIGLRALGYPIRTDIASEIHPIVETTVMRRP